MWTDQAARAFHFPTDVFAFPVEWMLVLGSATASDSFRENFQDKCPFSAPPTITQPHDA